LHRRSEVVRNILEAPHDQVFDVVDKAIDPDLGEAHFAVAIVLLKGSRHPVPHFLAALSARGLGGFV